MSSIYPDQEVASREYHYPRQWVLAWRLLFGVPSAVVLVHFMLGWGEAIMTLLQEVGVFPASAIRADFVDLSRNTWSLFFLLLLFYFFYDVLPKVRVTPTHLEVSFLRGWFRVAWSEVARLILTETGDSQRLLGLIQLRQRALPVGRRLAYSLHGALFGVGFVPGLLVTGDLVGFNEFLATLTARLERQPTPLEPLPISPGGSSQEVPASDVVREGYFSPLWQVVFQPIPTLERLVEGWSGLELRPALRLNLALAAAPALLFLMSSQLLGHNVWGVLFVLFFALLEGALGPVNLWALSDVFVQFPRVEEIAKVYPYAQLPRLLVYLPLALALLMRPPLLLWGLLWLAMAVWSARQARLLSEEIYGHPGSPLTWFGGAVAFVLQLVLFGGFALAA